MDSSLLQQQNSSFYATIPDSFWWYFPSILADGKYSRSVSPVSCSGDSCESYFFPGPLQIVKFAPNVSTVTTSDYPNVRTFIQEDAPGFQVDFYPLNGSNPALTLDDCRMYGNLSFIDIQLCLKSVSDSSFIAGHTRLISRADNSMVFLPVDPTTGANLFKQHNLACASSLQHHDVRLYATRFGGL